LEVKENKEVEDDDEEVEDTPLRSETPKVKALTTK
jgi:hypothetical protein